MNRVYTKEEIEFVREKSKTTKDKDLVEEFNSQFGRGVSFAAFRKMRQRLGITKKMGRLVEKRD
jgi:hypothetical protein